MSPNELEQLDPLATPLSSTLEGLVRVNVMIAHNGFSPEYYPSTATVDRNGHTEIDLKYTDTVNEPLLAHGPLATKTPYLATVQGHDDPVTIKIYGDHEIYPLGTLLQVFARVERLEAPLEEQMQQLDLEQANASCVTVLHVIRVVESGPQVLKDTAALEAFDRGTLSDTYQRLVAVVTSLMRGDALAAQYLLFHLLKRHDVSDEHAVNFTHCTVTQVEQLDAFLTAIVPDLRRIPISIDGLNKTQLWSELSYEKSKIGKLHVPNDSTVLLNETLLEEGKFTEKGVKNIAAIKNMMELNRLVLDFEGSPFETKITCTSLLFSTVKSIFKTDFEVPLDASKENELTSLEITETELEAFRGLYNFVKFGKHEYDIPERVSKDISERFAQARQMEAKNNLPRTTDLDLKRVLELSQVLCVSSGKTRLDSSMLQTALNMERQRMGRLRGQPLSGWGFISDVMDR